ncbi:unnamed protein product [Adineta ricciae]|uniref:Uncharacterized protein n=1 Tax=Adineta ricciae TaxID=249248 RepID=A0A814AQH9_ADIRI|nr:unnamed protein product [Adineta ricciae]CAF0918724.1 unnamed protein product [Adineta ricciae]
MSSSSTGSKKAAATMLKRNRFSVKNNSSKNKTIDRSQDSDQAETRKNFDPSKETNEHRVENANASVNIDLTERVLETSRKQKFKEFAGVTIVVKAATNSKHGTA